MLDRSASMTVGAPGRGKDEVTTELAVVLARLFTRGGNQVGAVLYDNGAVRTLPPGTGRRHVLHLAVLLSRTAVETGVAAAGGRLKRGRRRDNGPRGHSGTNGHRGNNGHRGAAAARLPGPTNLAGMLDAVARLARRRALIVVISDFIGDGDWERSPAPARTAA